MNIQATVNQGLSTLGKLAKLNPKTYGSSVSFLEQTSTDDTKEEVSTADTDITTEVDNLSSEFLKEYAPDDVAVANLESQLVAETGRNQRNRVANRRAHLSKRSEMKAAGYSTREIREAYSAGKKQGGNR